MAALRGHLAEAVTRAAGTTAHALRRQTVAVRATALAALVAGMAAIGYVARDWLDPIALRGWVQQAGAAGPPLFVLVFLTLNTAGVPLPVLGAAAGVAFGPILGTSTLLVAMTATACAQFLLARHVAGERVRERLGRALTRVNQLLERRGVIAVASARLLPGPFSEFNMVAGLTLVSLRDFTIGTVIGCAPKALAWSGLGALFLRG